MDHKSLYYFNIPYGQMSKPSLATLIPFHSRKQAKEKAKAKKVKKRKTKESRKAKFTLRGGPFHPESPGQSGLEPPRLTVCSSRVSYWAATHRL